jgi:pimeloyl-ACP methyl ester carboxylesterase
MTPIVMVHGAFVGGWSFEWFERRFREAGYAVHSPDLRGHAAGAPSEAVIGVSMRDYAQDLIRLCRSLPEPPVLLGHSMGGLVAQMAARAAAPRALVLLAPSPPWGLAGWSLETAVNSIGAHLAALSSNGAIEPSSEVMRHMSLDRMSSAEAAPVLARMRPESAQALREALCWWMDPFMTTSIGPGPLPTPSLVLTGDADRVHPPAAGRQVAERIGGGFESLPGMSHWLVGEPGWRDVADRVLDWLANESRAAA